jgi:hypothetical protein
VGSNLDEAVEFDFNSHNPSSYIMGLERTQHLTEMKTGMCLGNKAQPVFNADNLTVVYEPIL